LIWASTNIVQQYLQTKKLIIMQFSQAFWHCFPFWSIYSPNHPVLEHPQSLSFQVLTAVIMKPTAFWGVGPSTRVHSTISQEGVILTFDLCSSLNARDQLSHRYKAVGKNILLCI
jgi:hypothetical protein